ncbi:MAG: outer membrane lipoprotein chaperone LolA [Proteobacteria bacterium]|nr:outer membrane lipoprotein chaperone LolA [Pseudomonadota bacterium]
MNSYYVLKLPNNLSATYLLVLSLLMAPSFGYAAGTTQTATDTAERVQNYYASVNDYEASFVQTTAHKMFGGRLQRAYGKVIFKKGGLMRWEYTRPERKFFIYDGGTLWIYEPDVPQVFKGAADAERLAKALAFLTGEGRILDEYRAETLSNKKYNFPNGFVLGLWPKQKNSPFKRVEIYIEPQTYRVVRSVVVDQEGNRNRLDFATPSINKNLSDAVFSFTPPADVPVLQAP